MSTNTLCIIMPITIDSIDVNNDNINICDTNISNVSIDTILDAINDNLDFKELIKDEISN